MSNSHFPQSDRKTEIKMLFWIHYRSCRSIVVVRFLIFTGNFLIIVFETPLSVTILKMNLP